MLSLKKKFTAIAAVCLLLAMVTVASAESLNVAVPDDILPLKLGTQRATIAENLAKEMLGDKAKAQLTVYEKATDVITALLIGKVQAVIMDVAPAQRFLKANPGQLVILPQPLTTEEYAIAFSKADAQLCEDVSKALEEIKADGTLDAIFAKYEDGVYYTPAKDIDLNVGAAGGKIIVGTETGFPPYDIKDGNGFTGIDIEMCAAIAKKLGKELAIKGMTFDALFAAVNSAQVDMICAGITVTEDRKKNVLFSTPYVNAGQVIVVKAEDYAGNPEEANAAAGVKAPEIPEVAAPGELISVSQLKSEKIAVQRGSIGQNLAEEMLGDKAKSNMITYERIIDAIQALKDGKVRAVIMGDIPAQPFIRDPKQNLTELPEALFTAEIAIAVKKGNTELQEQLNAAMTEMMADGTIDAIIEKYFNDPQSTQPEDIDLNLGADKKIVMGTAAGFMPFEFKIGSGFVGIDVEICAVIAKKLGCSLSIADMAFDSLPAALASGKVDFICGGYTITEDRKKNADFTIPYMPAKQIALVRTDDCKK